MKRFLPLSLLMLSALGAGAAQLSPAQALARVKEEGPKRHLRLATSAAASPLLTVKAKNNSQFNGVYVFQNGDGFIVVSADDCARPLLGYGDSEFDSANIPSNLRYWLDFYAGEIQKAAASSNGKAKAPEANRSGAREAVEPLIKTKWNQDYPYNILCPEDDYGRSVTGCVATAMAQVMAYYQWPKQGTGSHSYEWNGKELSCDFSNTTFDWDLMTDIYDSSSTDEQKMAVAELMYNCGVAVDMNYSSNTSYAYTSVMRNALYDYFGYDKSMLTYNHYFFQPDEWENMIYRELAASRPILYLGTASNGSHEFICDGYDGEGYFHFNWGWGGQSDGYFLLSSLDPYDHGIGGSTDGDGFNSYQEIVVNIMPAKENSELSYAFANYSNVYVYSEYSDYPIGMYSDEFDGVDNSILAGDMVEVGCWVTSNAPIPVKVEMGVKLENIETGDVIYLADPDGEIELFPEYSVSSFLVEFPENLPDGNYVMSMVCNPENQGWREVLVPELGFNYYNLAVEDGLITFSLHLAADAFASDVKFTTPVYSNNEFDSEITFTNPGTKPAYFEYSILLYTEEGFYVTTALSPGLINLEAGETKTVSYSSQFNNMLFEDMETGELKELLPPGKYLGAVASNFAGLFLSDMFEVTILEAPETIVNATISLQGGKEYYETDYPIFDVSLNCVQGLYKNWAYVIVFGYDPDSQTSEQLGYSVIKAKLREGEPFAYKTEVSCLPGDFETLLAVVYGIDESTGGLLPWSEPLSFSKKTGTSGVDAASLSDAVRVITNGSELVVCSASELPEISIFSLTGTRLYHAEASGATSLSIPTAGWQPGCYLVVTPSAVRKVILP